MKNFLLEPAAGILRFSFYKEVPKKSMKRTLGYLLYVGFLFSVAQVAAFRLRFAPLLRESVDWAAQNIPVLTFKDGTVTSAAAAPLRLHPPRIEKIFIIDTTRAAPVTAQEMKQENAAAYLTQNALYVAGGNDEIQSLDLAKTRSSEPLVVDAAFYRQSGRALSLILYPVVGLLSWVLFFCWKLGAGWAYSALGMVFNMATSAGLSYESLYKIAIYAQTPVILLQAVALFSSKETVGFIVIAWFVAGYYTWHAVRLNRVPGSQAS